MLSSEATQQGPAPRWPETAPSPKRASIRLRFTLVIVAAILGVASALGGYFVNQIHLSADQALGARADSLAASLAYNSEYAAFVANREMLRRYAQGVMREEDVEYVIIEDRDGGAMVILGRHDPEALPERLPGGAAAGASSAVAFRDRRGVHLLEARAPILLRSGEGLGEELFLSGAGAAAQGEPIGAVRVGLSREAMRQKVRNLQAAALLITAATSLLGAALAIVFVRRIVGPLRVLVLGTQRIARGDLAYRVPVEAGDEIGELAESFNRMTEDLGRARAELEAHSSELERKVRERTRRLEEAQSRLLQSEKLGAIGQLVAGVAHELNNPLTGVLGYAQLLMRRSHDPETRRALEKIDAEATRCKKIVQNLLTFARKQKTAKALIDVNQAVERALELRAYQLRLDNIEVITDLAPDLPQTMADFHQLQQAFLNIIVNAHQAMEGGQRRGRLILRSRREGERIVVEIEDNGPGIPAGLRERIFDPFFTTKEVGTGTGLGLSICYGIFQEHGGRIGVESEVGRGTRFILELPIILDGTAAASEDAAAAAAREPEPGPGRGLRILVVDDEPSVVEILYRVLGEEGYQIETAASGSAALTRIVKQRFDLIISDIKMPGMHGAELYARVREIDPLLASRMVFITGDLVSAATRHFLERTGNPCIEKPFVLEDVRRCVRDFARELEPRPPAPTEA
jgi:signal transduction histidine kinase/ActR/RegA family two-component response regulator